MRNKCKWHSSFRNSKWACVSTTLCAFGDLSIEMLKISVSENGLRGEYITSLGKIFHYQLGFLLKHTPQFPRSCTLWSWLSVQPSLLSTFNIGVCGKWEREPVCCVQVSSTSTALLVWVENYLLIPLML